MIDDPITVELLKKWRSALHTQYQIRGDAIVPRNSMEAPTIEQMSLIRSAHHSIIPLIDYCLASARPAQVVIYQNAKELDKPEGKRTKAEEWEGAYAVLFNQLNPVMEENKRLKAARPAMGDDVVALREALEIAASLTVKYLSAVNFEDFDDREITELREIHYQAKAALAAIPAGAPVPADEAVEIDINDDDPVGDAYAKGYADGYKQAALNQQKPEGKA